MTEAQRKAQQASKKDLYYNWQDCMGSQSTSDFDDVVSLRETLDGMGLSELEYEMVVQAWLEGVI